MPRQARLMLPDLAAHVTQRGHNRDACFRDAQDFGLYRRWLAEYADRTGCLVHAYVLMTNHVHLLVTGRSSLSVSSMMQRLSQRYTQYVNRRYRRSGSLWEGRFHSCLVGEDDYVLACYRYLELNPVRAGMVARPADYRWSSHRSNIGDSGDCFLVPHDTYCRLGRTPEARRQAYLALFQGSGEPGLATAIGQATGGTAAIGSPRFVTGIESRCGRRAVPRKPGRPQNRENRDRPRF